MDSALMSHLRSQIESYLKSRQDDLSKRSDRRISYGTAGFRGKASEIERIFFHVGLISALKCIQSKANIGLMITASHNPVEDNGVKLIESNGEMLSLDWEPIVEKFCNTNTTDELLQQLQHIIDRYNIDINSDAKPIVMIGMDTRPSSEALVKLVKQGIDSWMGKVQSHDYGLITTPALHYVVAQSNRQNIPKIKVDFYYNQLIDGICNIFDEQSESSNYKADQLVIDCANGVGFETMRILMNNDRFRTCLPVKLINTGEGILNGSCGADFVKSTGLSPVGACETGKRYAALDGDADRVVYFYLVRDGSGDELKLQLIDGDKIMALFALFLQKALAESKLDGQLSMGLVQTAYANGASTEYLSSVLNLKVDCVDTGVKNLHHQVLKYDIGVYFEANGHGTIHFTDKAREVVEQNNAVALKKVFKLINNFTGDAISDILVVESILRIFDWDVKTWSRLYQDRPNSLIKVQVRDRNFIETTNASRTCTKPVQMQSFIDNQVELFGSGARCFVRPSGTENVVRIYAEANDQQSADRLAETVGQQVMKMSQD